MVDLLVLGAGVSGLTCAVRLLEMGFTVEVWAKDIYPNASMNAAAFLYPFHTAGEDPRVLKWLQTTHTYMKELAAVPDSGVRLCPFIEYKRSMAPVVPSWISTICGARLLTPAELVHPLFKSGFMIDELPVITPKVHLEWLRRQVNIGGGKIVQVTVASLDECFSWAPVVVNCTGLGARELSGESSMYPTRGQVVRIRHNGLKMGLLDGDDSNDLAYAVPHGDGSKAGDFVLLGGTYEAHVGSTAPSAPEVLKIVERCRRLLPSLKLNADDIINTSCGLRPCAPAVKLETRNHAQGLEIINVGHGGAGYTLANGCALDVCRLASAAAGARIPASINVTADAVSGGLI